MVSGPVTPMMQMPIPAENEDPFYARISSFFNALDAWVQAVREDAGVYVKKSGGNWTVGPADLVSWDSTIEVWSVTDGGYATDGGGGGSVTCPDGHLIYMQIPSRPIAGALAGTIAAGAALPALSGLAIPIAFRDGSSIVQLGRGTATGGGGTPQIPPRQAVIYNADTTLGAGDSGKLIFAGTVPPIPPMIPARPAILTLPAAAEGLHYWIWAYSATGALANEIRATPGESLYGAYMSAHGGPWAAIALRYLGWVHVMAVPNGGGGWLWSVGEGDGSFYNASAPAQEWILGVAQVPAFENQIAPWLVDLTGGPVLLQPAGGETYIARFSASDPAVTIDGGLCAIGGRVRFQRAQKANGAITITPNGASSIVCPDNDSWISAPGYVLINGNRSGVTLELVERTAGVDTWLVVDVWGNVIDWVSEPLRATERAMPRVAVLSASTANGMNDCAGSALAAAWTPRVLTGKDPGCALPVDIVSHNVLAADAAGSWFRVSGDQTRFYPAGKRFACQGSGTANDTTDAEFLVSVASYDGVNDWTTITVVTVGAAAYIKTAVVDDLGGSGWLYPGWFGLSAAYRLRGRPLKVAARLYGCGRGCGAFQLRILSDDLSMPSMTFSIVDGSYTGGGMAERVDTLPANSPMGWGDEVTAGEGVIDMVGGSDTYYLIQQYINQTNAGPPWFNWGGDQPVLAGMADRRLVLALTEVTAK